MKRQAIGGGVTFNRFYTTTQICDAPPILLSGGWAGNLNAADLGPMLARRQLTAATMPP